MAETFTGYVEAETQKAFLFQDHFWHSPDWMPKSQVDVVRYDDTHEITLVAQPWICGQKGIRECVERVEADG